jgi:hypothetical protein
MSPVLTTRKDSPAAIPPKRFAVLMFVLSALIALVGVRLATLTWGTDNFPPTVFFTGVGFVAAVSLGVWALNLAPRYVKPIRDDF